MSSIVVGLGTSHGPMLSMEPQHWNISAEFDKKPGRELMSPLTGKLVNYETLLAEADPSLADRVNQKVFNEQYAACQRGIDTLARTLREAKPDLAIIVGNDQEERFFDDNMPAISIYCGSTWTMKPWTLPDYLPEAFRVSMWGYGESEKVCAIDTEAAEHLAESLIYQDFDISISRYEQPSYGGTVGPAGYLNYKRETKTRPHGMGHAFAFVVRRLMDQHYIPFVPISLNTCYPPNQPTSTRCYDLGRAIGRAVATMGGGKRVAIIGSGGLSHFVVDEELDRAALQAMKMRDRAALAALPRHRLQSAASEIKTWIAAAGALEHLAMETVEYVACRRTPAGTGGGWGFARWV